MKIEWTRHARDMLRERGITEEWVLRTINDPDRTLAENDGMIHYIKVIPEQSGRFLRVVLNSDVQPPRVVTVFFDRRLRREP